MIERYVAGRELAVTVLGPPTTPEVLPVIEIETEEPFYTFRAHYDPGAATMREAELEPTTCATRVEAVAAQAYTAAGCRDLGRVDIILDAAGTRPDPGDQHDPGADRDRADPLRRAGGRDGLQGPDRARDLARHGVMRRATASPSSAPASTSDG